MTWKLQGGVLLRSSKARLCRVFFCLIVVFVFIVHEGWGLFY